MPEWPNGAVSKTVVRASGPRVRIPLSPQPGAKPLKGAPCFSGMIVENEVFKRSGLKNRGNLAKRGWHRVAGIPLGDQRS